MNTVPHSITITRPAPITDLPDPIRLVRDQDLTDGMKIVLAKILVLP